MSIRVRELATDLGFTEGPVVAPDGTIYVTSLTHGRVYRVDPHGAVPFGETGGGANGAALAADGSLYIAQNGGRMQLNTRQAWPPSSVGGVQRISPDGEVSWVTQEPISPNDLCFGPDGMLYVTDPTRFRPTPERPVDGRIWRVDPGTGATELLLAVPWLTNGIGFGADDALYVAATHSQRVYRYDVTSEGLAGESVAVQLVEGGPDGFAFDADGNLVIGAIGLDDESVGTVQTWTPDGRLVRTLELGSSRHYANVAFTPGGGLVITDSTAGGVLLAEGWPVSGLPLHPFR